MDSRVEDVTDDSGSVRFDAVLFDCDGVLVDSELITNRVLRTMLGELGWELSESECIDRFVGRSVRDERPVIERHTGTRLDDTWILEFRARRDVALRADLTAIDGSGEAVAAVFAQFGERLACVSGADRGKIEMQLAATGLDHFFSGRVFSGMEQPRTKPAPDVYLAAAETLRIAPARAAVIEDSVAGVTAGVAAGATVFGYAPASPTHSHPEVLLEAGASHVFHDMRQLPDLLSL